MIAIKMSFRFDNKVFSYWETNDMIIKYCILISEYTPLYSVITVEISEKYR